MGFETLGSAALERAGTRWTGGLGLEQNPLNNLLIGNFFVGWMPFSGGGPSARKRDPLLFSRNAPSLEQLVGLFSEHLGLPQKKAFSQRENRQLINY